MSNRYPFGRGAHRNPKPDNRKLKARKPAHHRTPVEQAMKTSELEERKLREQMERWGLSALMRPGINHHGPAPKTAAEVLEILEREL